jgi:transcriptional regulator of acetoin/glycerol metabolism
LTLARGAPENRAVKQQWQERLRQLPYSEPARYAIVESWQRSAAAGLAREGRPRFRQVTDLSARLERCAGLVEVARPRLSRLLKSLPGTTNVVYLTDPDGIVLFSAGDPRQLAQFGLTPGYDWSEKAMGTNGVGTALASRAPVAIVGSAHFMEAFADCTCTGAPVMGPDRSLAGAIDVSSSVADAAPERLSQVIAVALEIEAELYDRWRRTAALDAAPAEAVVLRSEPDPPLLAP